MDAVWVFLRGPFGSFLRVVVGVLLGFWVVDIETNGIHFDATEWSLWVGAAIAAGFPVLLAWLNPTDTRFGVGSG